MDGARPAEIGLAICKALTAARYRQPTEALESAIDQGCPAAITAGTTEMEGGVPIASGCSIIGAVGVSGVSKSNEVKVAEAAAQAVR